MLKSTADSALTSLSARSAGVADASIAPLSVGVETATVGDTKYNACLGYTNGIEMQFSDGVRVGITSGDVSGASHDYWWNTPTYAENNTMSDALSVYGVGVSWDGIGGWNIFNTTLSYSRTIAQSWHQDNSYNPHYSGFATQYAHSATATFEFPSATCRVSASASHLF